jgi:aspartate carbamoyltransferase catalytic subunit
LKMKHLLSTDDLSRVDAIKLLDTAAAMAATQEREIKKLPTLRGRTVVNLFFEDSTRTRISFETAAKRLSADVINFSAKGSSASKGESLKDTALTLHAMGADAVVVRSSASGAAHRLAHANWLPKGDLPPSGGLELPSGGLELPGASHVAVLNAGDGTHQHPTQALLDAYTIRNHLMGQKGGSDTTGLGLDGLKVAIVGDVLHSRVARSNAWLLNTLGAEVTLVAPPTLMPVGVEAWPAQTSFNLDQVIAEQQPDAVMMLRVQRERMGGTDGGSGSAMFIPSPQEYTREYGLDRSRLARLPQHTLVMHPGPMNRGLEISADAADSVNSVIVEQVTNGVAVRMAALYLLLAGGEGI